MIIKQTHKFISELALKLRELLIAPLEHLDRPDDRRRASVAAALLLISFLMVGIEILVAGNVPVIVELALFGGYWLTRTSWYRAATWILLLVLVVPSYIVVLTLPQSEPNRVLTAFGWVAVPLILGSLIFSFRVMTLFSLANLVAISLLPFIRTELSYYALSGTLGFLTLISAAVLIVMNQRNKLEQDRQAELRDNEQKFRSFIEQSSDGLLLADERGNIIEWNQAQERLTGYTSQECIGLPLWDFQLRMLPPAGQTPEARQRVKKRFTSALQSGQADFMDKALEVEIWRKDGTKLFVQQMAFGIKTQQGYRLGSIVRDVTEQKRLEALTHLRLRLFEFAANHSTVELLQKTLDEVGELTDSPIGFYHFVEEDQKTLTLQAWSTRTLDEFCKAEEESLHYPIGQAGVWADAVRQRRAIIHNDYSSLPDRKGMPEGHATVTRELVVPIQRGNRVVAVLGVGNKPQEYTDKDLEIVSYLADVTWELAERKQAEQEREELIKKLEAQNAELERFTYTVSHDLKSPLVTIQGFLGYLEEDMAAGDIERFRQDSQRIANAVDSMNSQLKDLLELSRIGRLMNPPEDVPFDEIAQEVLEILHGGLEARGVTVTLSPNLPTVHGDRQRLNEVLQNLVDNAVKFMGDQPDPHIEIGQEGEEDGKLIFFVRDNGIGIPSKYYERIFGLFERLDAQYEGTGIGLALVKRIVEYHGGRIWVESEVGTGSVFYFSLPLKPAE